MQGDRHFWHGGVTLPPHLSSPCTLTFSSAIKCDHQLKPRGERGSCCCEWTTQTADEKTSCPFPSSPNICSAAAHSAHPSSSIEGSVLRRVSRTPFPNVKAAPAALTFPPLPSGDPYLSLLLTPTMSLHTCPPRRPRVGDALQLQLARLVTFQVVLVADFQ